MDIKERACLTKATLSESVPQADLAYARAGNTAYLAEPGIEHVGNNS